MVYAYIMVKTAAGTSEGLLDDIRALDPVVDAHIVAGNYDIVAEVTGEEVYDVLQTSSSSLQQLDGVTNTRTYIAMD